MEKFGKSQSVARVVDRRLLTGQGRFIDDIAPDGAFFASVRRSTVAHAVFTALDIDAARQMPDVHLVVGADDLAQAGIQQAKADRDAA